MKSMSKKQSVVAPRYLTELSPGEGGIVAATPTANERLAEIGLVKGEYVQLVKLAPFGDPAIIQVLDAPIIVRRADLAGIMVT